MSIDYFNKYLEQYLEDFYKIEDIQVVNSFIMSIDAEVYYSMIRHLKPNLVIEVGGGYSSLFADRALLASPNGSLDIIEPFPSDLLKKTLGTFITEKPVQEVELERFSELKENDILFVDSSHLVSQGSDVEFILNKVLPILSEGVHVHFHDIYLPHEYSEFYGKAVEWNEQEFVKKHVTDNPNYEVIWHASQLFDDNLEWMKSTFKSYGAMHHKFKKARPSSLWVKKLC